MKKNIVSYKIFGCLLLLFGGIFSLVDGQYYYFDTGTAYPFQQGCSETLTVKINTEGQGVRAGRFHLIFNTGHFSYSNSDISSLLRTQLFTANSSTFTDRSASTSPSRKTGSYHSILQIDRKNDLINYNGSGGIYGTFIGITPLFNTGAYTGILAMEYFPGSFTTETTLSAPGGVEIINSAHQLLYTTGYFPIQQAPCVNDNNTPIATILTPLADTNKQSFLSGIKLTLNEPIGSTNVPYVRTGGGIWTGNLWGIDNQYGIDFSRFSLLISGNGQQKIFTGGMFSPSGALSFSTNGATWQFLDRNFMVNISGSELFNYGIEQPISISGTIYDRNHNIKTFFMNFNSGSGPTLIGGSLSPGIHSSWVNINEPIRLGIQDERAGVDTASITITLSGVSGTEYGPYVFSGNDLTISGVVGIANQPNQYITLQHPAFPYSGAIQVQVYAKDMVGNIDQINNYIFNTRPSCAALGCCNDITIQTGINVPTVYNSTILHISGGINPTFIQIGSTGIIDCGTINQGINIYKGQEENSGLTSHLSPFDMKNLIFSGVNVKAILSGKTIYLQKIYIPPINTGSCSTCGGGVGGAGSTITKDSCMLPSTLACANTSGIDASLSYYDNTCCGTEIQTGHNAADTCEVIDSPFTQEITEAFQWGYTLNITNRCPITSAHLDKYITRIEAAKMMSMFTIQIIGIYPDSHKTGCNNFSDISMLSDEMKFFAKTSCQLNIMGLEPNGITPKKTFNPYDLVDRAQFGTILSRLIYGDVYNINTGEQNKYTWYEKHLHALYVDNIMTKISTPNLLEKRARVLLMLKRVKDNNLTEKYRLVTPLYNGALSLLENVR